MSKSKFQEILQVDINNVFFNVEEFAEVVLVNGQEMEVVFDTDVINQSDTSKQLAAFDVAFHTKTDNFEHIPQSEMLMKLNDETFRIKSVNENMGMVTIGLSRLDS